MGLLRIATVAAHFGRDLQFDLDRIRTLIEEARVANAAFLALSDGALGGCLADFHQPDPDNLPPALGRTTGSCGISPPSRRKWWCASATARRARTARATLRPSACPGTGCSAVIARFTCHRPRPSCTRRGRGSAPSTPRPGGSA